MKSPLSFLRAPGAAILCSYLSVTSSAQTLAEDFEDQSLAPFGVEVSTGNLAQIITPSGFAARAGTRVHHLKWYQSNYNGTRPTKSVEGLSGLTNPRITSEGWYGFSLYAPTSFPVPGKRMALGQIHAWDPSLPSTNITITVGVESSGRLVLEGAYGVGDGGKTTTVYATLTPVLTKGSWHDFVIYCKFSRNNTGILRAWLDGAPESAPTASFTGINLGNGAWTNDTLMTNGAYVKWGPYCWDNANYTTSESREIYYDEIAYQVGNPAGAFDLVKPSGYGTGYAAPAPGTVVVAENYDAMTPGTQPTGWTVVKPASTALTVREIPSVTDKCMQFWDGNATGRIEATKTFTAQTTRATAGWSFMQNGQGEGHCMALISGTLAVVELYTIGGNLVYRDSLGINQVLQAVPANTWYKVDVDVNPTTQRADVYVGGVRKLTGASLRNAASSFDAIRFGTSDASATWHLYINDVSITQSPVLYAENFNAMTTGAAPAEWLVVNGASTASSVLEYPSATDKSLRLWDGNTAAKTEAAFPFVAQATAFAATWSFRQNFQDNGHRMALTSGYGATAVELFTSNGNLVYRNSAGTDVFVQAIPHNTWYEVKLVVRPNTNIADVYVNGVLKLSNQALRSSVTAVDRILFGSSDATATAHLYINNISVTTADVPPLAALAAGIPRLPIVLKLDDLNTGGGNVPSTWRRVTDYTQARRIKATVGLIAKSLEVGNASYLSYIQGLKNGGHAEIWFHGYDHSSQEFNGKTYTDQKNRFTTSQTLAVTKLGFSFAAFGAPENAFDNTTVQVMSEDPAMQVWIYGDPARPAGKTVLERVSAVNIESPTFIPNPEKLLSGYLANYASNDYFAIQGHPGNWNDARWADFVRLVDWLIANGFPIMSHDELAATL